MRGMIGGFLAALLVVAVVVTLPPRTEVSTRALPDRGAAQLLEAIRVVETGGSGDANILQITPIMVDECNRIAGRERFVLDDRLSVEKSEEMFWVYSDYWAARTHDYTLEGIARRWNGGPTGHRKPETERYWHRVRSLLPQIRGVWSGN